MPDRLRIAEDCQSSPAASNVVDSGTAGLAPNERCAAVDAATSPSRQRRAAIGHGAKAVLRLESWGEHTRILVPSRDMIDKIESRNSQP